MGNLLEKVLSDVNLIEATQKV
ncbi:MAG: hypothetical protein K0Q49_575, partial [Haloplasmataceae bacterium]|nr:hypothetical protein [Haloplasmataceae bacterium]